MKPLDPMPPDPAPQPARALRPAPPSLAAVLLSRLLGYLVAWALVLGLAMAACSAMTAPRPQPSYVPVTLPPIEEPAPDPTAPGRTAKPHRTPAPTAEPVLVDPTILYDCGDADPADPEIDPEWDCVPL